jgi:hypothetical protein
MKTRSSIALGTAALLWAVAWLMPSGALASTKCLCNNGEVVQSMDDAENAEEADEICEDACSMFGGGQRWDPRLDRGYDDDDGAIHRGHERAPARSRH